VDLTSTFFAIIAAGFLVGVVVGLTGMGGGALMTPALIFLGVGEASTVVTADLTAAAIYKTGGAWIHRIKGSPHMRLAFWLMAGSVPAALISPQIIPRLVSDPGELETVLKLCIGFALLFAATTYAIRFFMQTRRQGGIPDHSPDPEVRPIPTLLIGVLGGLLVGITSVGSGSVIMIALTILYPTLSARKLVGTDLVQAVPLVLAAALSNILVYGLDWALLIPLVIGSVPGTALGSLLAPKIPQALIRRGIVTVLTMSGIALLDKAGWKPLGAGDDQIYPLLYVVVGVVVLIALPIAEKVIVRPDRLDKGPVNTQI
jgi:uncharacterized protein